MSRASKLLNWFYEQDEDEIMQQNDNDDGEEIPDKGIKVKDYIKKQKQAAKSRGELVDDDPNVIDKNDDDTQKAAKVAHHIDRTSGTTKEGQMKNYAFPTKRVSRDDN